MKDRIDRIVESVIKNYLTEDGEGGFAAMGAASTGGEGALGVGNVASEPGGDAFYEAPLGGGKNAVRRDFWTMGNKAKTTAKAKGKKA